MPNNSVSPDFTKDDRKKEQAKREKNVMAYKDLILSIDTSKDKGKIAFQIVKTSTSELKGGDAALVWKQLKEKYAPKIAPRKVELMKEFQRMSLKSSSEDLDVWLTKLELIRVKLAQMSYDVTKEQMIIHMLNNLLEEYDIQVSKLESRLDDKTNPLTISEIQTK